MMQTIAPWPREAIQFHHFLNVFLTVLLASDILEEQSIFMQYNHNDL